MTMATMSAFEGDWKSAAGYTVNALIALVGCAFSTIRTPAAAINWLAKGVQYSLKMGTLLSATSTAAYVGITLLEGGGLTLPGIVSAATQGFKEGLKLGAIMYVAAGVISVLPNIIRAVTGSSRVVSSATAATSAATTATSASNWISRLGRFLASQPGNIVSQARIFTAMPEVVFQQSLEMAAKFILINPLFGIVTSTFNAVVGLATTGKWNWNLFAGDVGLSSLPLWKQLVALALQGPGTGASLAPMLFLFQFRSSSPYSIRQGFGHMLDTFKKINFEHVAADTIIKNAMEAGVHKSIFTTLLQEIDSALFVAVYSGAVEGILDHTLGSRGLGILSAEQVKTLAFWALILVPGYNPSLKEEVAARAEERFGVTSNEL